MLQRHCFYCKSLLLQIKTLEKCLPHFTQLATRETFLRDHLIPMLIKQAVPVNGTFDYYLDVRSEKKEPNSALELAVQLVHCVYHHSHDEDHDHHHNHHNHHHHHNHHNHHHHDDDDENDYKLNNEKDIHDDRASTEDEDNNPDVIIPAKSENYEERGRNQSMMSMEELSELIGDQSFLLPIINYLDQFSIKQRSYFYYFDHQVCLRKCQFNLFLNITVLTICTQ